MRSSHRQHGKSHRRTPRTRLSVLTLENRITPVRVSSMAADRWPVAAEMAARTATAGMWTELTAVPPAPEGKTSYLQLDDFLPFTLNSSAMQAVLGRAPLESNVAAPDSPIVLALPKPDGSMAHFRIVNTPMMEPGLAARYPEIQTYRGQGIDDPTATLAADFTPHGFHAQVLSPDGSWYIDPYFHLDSSVYASYAQEDLTPREPPPCLTCQGAGCTLCTRPSPDALVADAEPAVAASESNFDEGEGGGVAQRSGTQLRTYRAAVAGTGEYTQFHGGSVALGLAAITTAMNRVSGIYELEFSIRMVLIANNNLIVYTNPSTDPYTNNEPSTMLGQNQSNLNSVIGAANYDVGHVFARGNFGGVAVLRSVGFNNIKARGASTSEPPINDPFTVRVVSHEFGHQFGANHTFNAPNSNRNSSTAYEPGSGSTIMSYAGVLGANNLQNGPDPYFHSISFDEVISFVDGQIFSVGTRTSTGNIVPVISALQNYAIPTNTPFALTASATDGNGDTLTYNWEQRSIGAAQNLSEPDNGQSPIFRSWTGTVNPTRTFPRLSNLINNTLPVGEKYPAVARSSMAFRVTVRDNRAGGGGVNTRDMSLQIVNTGAAFQVTAPNSNVTWLGGSTQTVTWNAAGTTAAPINAAMVNIYLSTNGGNTFPILLAANTPNDGSEAIQMPFGLGTSQARIKVEPTNNVFFDFSNVNFTITNVPPPNPPQVTSVTVNGGVGDQRSMVRSIDVTFDSQVNFLNNEFAAAFQVARFGGGQLGTFTATPNVVGGVTVVTLDAFSGTETQFSSLADGRYQLTVFANRVSNAGGQLGGGVNYTFGQPEGPEHLARYFGDWTGDRRVDGADFIAFVSTYNQGAGSPLFLSAFDFNDSNNVDAFDFGHFVQRYNVPIP